MTTKYKTKTYTFKIKARAKARPRVTSRGTYMPPEYMQYKRDLLKLADAQDYELKPPKLNIRFHFAVPKSAKNRIGKLHDQKPDLDNLVGGVMDALMHLDHEIAIIEASKWWSDEDYIEILEEVN